MKPFSTFTWGIIAMSAWVSSSALAATFVYVSNADDGDIGAYAMQADGTLAPLARAQAAKVVMPMAQSPNRRLLYAASHQILYALLAVAATAFWLLLEDRGREAQAQVAGWCGVGFAVLLALSLLVNRSRRRRH